LSNLFSIWKLLESKDIILLLNKVLSYNYLSVGG